MANGARRASDLDPEAERLSALVKAIGESSPNLIYAKDRERRMLNITADTGPFLALLVRATRWQKHDAPPDR